MDDFDGLGWQDIAFLSGMAEDIANEELEKEKACRDTLGENYLEPEDPATDFDFDPEDDW